MACRTPGAAGAALDELNIAGRSGKMGMTLRFLELADTVDGVCTVFLIFLCHPTWLLYPAACNMSTDAKPSSCIVLTASSSHLLGFPSELFVRTGHRRSPQSSFQSASPLHMPHYVDRFLYCRIISPAALHLYVNRLIDSLDIEEQQRFLLQSNPIHDEKPYKMT
ncbi:hypothetical protein BV25DRAFT_238314 [Artomyces pyxidatus]|uniref:Uncharacterized protein n=1 Tax=Artomyces pyxidatus TaxID=48021 RepID=A0ACB8T7Q5_9AGAM|nr:hypothetical protein BV25DRAFT_238314 [Artomyces pyxidatus]